ncbi:hypothetical protein SAM40697_1638 [Streptomyces ambofaciens]|uniref:Uncharacterized protein n=1 Tax=Streptomyces ambofaciens TaxID=1889 RepID=A0ABM6AYE4_STRAM|nr:hypothetical protein SAM40697_1638 [Streptomyces ambofaciens]
MIDALDIDLAPVVAEEPWDAGVDRACVRADVERLHGELDEARAVSALPEAPTVYDALHDFVVRVRLER